MPELGEIISQPELEAEFKENCPFKEESEGGPEKSKEDIGFDDRDNVQETQANDGGTLGKNLEAKEPGVGTAGPFPPDDFLYKQPANDSKRGETKVLHLEEYKQAEAGDFPFTVAAHHLIPGNASLYKTIVKLINYMEDKGKVQSAVKKKKFAIDGHIGYDVNGSHNGVWLPGNYAIQKARPERTRKDGTVIAAREGTTPVEDKSWSQLYEAWQYEYVAGACKAGKGQFHDSHEDPYSATARKNLLKIVAALATHLDTDCPVCSSKEKVLPPPFRIKMRLYALSQTLRGFVQGHPLAWKAPWFTSQKWSKKFFKDGEITPEFLQAYENAKVVDL